MIESKKRIFSGVDVKRFQYEEYATNLSDKQINLKDLISKFLFKKPVDMNCVMINLEKDTNRYDKTLDEFKKVSIANFSHLKATYWKEREIFENDITSVIDFLKQFAKIYFYFLKGLSSLLYLNKAQRRLQKYYCSGKAYSSLLYQDEAQRMLQKYFH